MGEAARHRLRALLILGIALLLFAFFDLAKHFPPLAAVVPFLEDPYDAVGSFATQLAIFAGLLALLRAFRPYAPGVIPPAQVRLIFHAEAAVLLSVALTLLADILAMARYPAVWASTPTGYILAFLVLLLALISALAVVWVSAAAHKVAARPARRPWLRAVVILSVAGLVFLFYPPGWRQGYAGAILTALAGMVCFFLPLWAIGTAWFPARDQKYEDLLDDLAAVWNWMKTRWPSLSPILGGVEKIAARPWSQPVWKWLNPRQHPWRIPLLASAAIGLALVIFEMIGEGAPDSLRQTVIVAVVFIGLEACGLLLGYALLRRWLGVFHG